MNSANSAQRNPPSRMLKPPPGRSELPITHCRPDPKAYKQAFLLLQGGRRLCTPKMKPSELQRGQPAGSSPAGPAQKGPLLSPAPSCSAQGSHLCAKPLRLKAERAAALLARFRRELRYRGAEGLAQGYTRSLRPAPRGPIQHLNHTPFYVVLGLRPKSCRRFATQSHILQPFRGECSRGPGDQH